MPCMASAASSSSSEYSVGFGIKFAFERFSGRFRAGAARCTASTMSPNSFSNQPFCFQVSKILFKNLSAKNFRVVSHFNARLKRLRTCTDKYFSYFFSRTPSAVFATCLMMESAA